MMTRRRRFSWFELSAELKRRRVYAVIGAYAVIGWIVLQIGEVTFEPLGLPGWSMTMLIVTVIVGFPVVLILAWTFDITSTGIRRDRKPLFQNIAADDMPSIAVLPFVDLSPNKDQGYFCDGIAEEILNALTRIPDLRVAARSSSFQFRGSAGDVQEIGKALGVKAILEGSVRRANNHLRVTAQLVKTSDGYHLWSKSFAEELKDVFAIQDEIATSIVAALLKTITAKRPVRAAWSKDVTAYDYYLRGRYFLRQFRKTDIESARQMFSQAINLDDEFALAWAGYADCHSLLIMYEDPKPSYREKAAQASKRALELNPNLAEAHASSGLSSLVSADYESAEAEFKKALELNPRLFEAFYYYGRTRFHQGDLPMAADLFRQAADVDPEDYKSLCLRIQILRGLGRIEEASKEAKEAIAVIERRLEWNPDDACAYHCGAGSLVAMGDVDRAKRWLHRALEIDPDDSVLLYNVACSLATMGEADAALDYLERAMDHGVINAPWMRNDSDLASLREDSRFVNILARLEKKEARVSQVA
ncbi:MAG: tetratricopeptide repeat protein [Gammaproteobacteria bacterium]|nr:tetratricopeptide repeat protein [Gammaproteobacteria bacterium]